MQQRETARVHDLMELANTSDGKATKRIVSHQWGGFFRRSRRMALHRLRHLLHSAAAHRTVRPLAAQRGSAVQLLAAQPRRARQLAAQPRELGSSLLRPPLAVRLLAAANIQSWGAARAGRGSEAAQRER